jgi:hypothetical protein
VPRRTFSPRQLQAIRDLASRWGKIVARQAFGDAGPGLDVDLAALEQIAEAAAKGVTEGTLSTLLEQQAQQLGGEQPCPDCGRLCRVGREERPLKLRSGPLTQSEPVCHCPDCRRDFFPPAAPAPARQPRLQPRRTPGHH